MATSTGRVTLNPPSDIDLDELAKSTTDALAYLLPWCGEEQKWPILQAISEQARLFVRAICFSANAAQQGYNIAEDAIMLSGYLSNQASKKTRNECAQKMVVCAKDAYNRANKSLQKFRTIRQNMLKLIVDAQQSKELDTVTQGEIEKLKEGIPIQSFMTSLSTFISWWGWMDMEANAHVDISEKLTNIDYSSLTKASVVAKWKTLRGNFERYTASIAQLEDLYRGTALLPASGNIDEDPLVYVKLEMSGKVGFFRKVLDFCRIPDRRK